MAQKRPGRPTSGIRGVTNKGRDFGVRLTDTDLARVRLLGRWYCLTLDHLTRAELDPTHWHPDHITDNTDGRVSTAYEKKAYLIRRRLAKLVRIEENPAAHVGPVVAAAELYERRTGWHATRYGITAAGLPWSFRPAVNPRFAHHAWAAASVGMQIERAGFTVLSEREIATGTDQHGDDITARLNSEYSGPHGGRQVTKKPDLAVLSPGGTNYVAVEVERWNDRPLRDYTEKLTAYQDNTAIKAVWYLCGSETVQSRVIQAATKIGLPTDFPLRMRVMRDVNGLPQIPNLAADQKMLADMRAVTTEDGDVA